MPSRLAETCRGVEPGLVGWSHHRWLVEIAGTHIRFVMKYHRIHSHWRLSIPASVLARLPDEQQVQWMFWEDRFTVEEVTIHGVETSSASSNPTWRRSGRTRAGWCAATPPRGA
jgi:hypothetical protein